jgi:hypothetical protein
MDLSIYCDVGFEFCFSPPFWGVVDPGGGVAKWLAVKGVPPLANRLREVGQYHTRHSPTQGPADNVIEMHELVATPVMR